MNRADPARFPWEWLYYRALVCGMGAEAFWKSSPRAVLLMFDVYREAHGGGNRGRNAASAAHSIRLSRIPR